MHRIEELRTIYQRDLFAARGFTDCSDWAVRSLENDDEGEDLEIALLAGSGDVDERKCLTEAILLRYLGAEALCVETAAGKQLVELCGSYSEGATFIADIDRWLTRVYSKLRYPSWLVMLKRNCECAADVDAFVETFEEELRYVAGLWRESNSLDDFKARYDRNVSNTHDLPSASKHRS